MTGSRPLEGLRILVADDDPDALDALAALLEMNGAEVRRCRNGAQARGALEAFRPHLLISDLAMPVEDGFELIAAVRALKPEEGGTVPAIAFSSVLDRSIRARALECGFQDFVGKPTGWTELLGKVAALVARGADPAS